MQPGLWRLNWRCSGATGVLVGLAMAIAPIAHADYPVRNVEAEHLAHVPGEQLVGGHDTLLIVTASGGGTRATALTLSTLRGLAMVHLPSGETLADNIDIISSVSGGSVAAAAFALGGANGLNSLEANFVRKNVMRTLLWRGLNPVGLVRLAMPQVERIDPLIDYLNRPEIFHHATFKDIPRDGHHPYLILNAADMVTGTPFSFTPETFNLICSDLDQLPVATAVASSAAFPVFLSPVTLTDYSHCAAQNAERWPPPWVGTDTSWYDNPPRVMRQRVAAKYAKGGRNGSGQTPGMFIHLLDGGIADNLGVSEPFRLLTTNDVSPSLLSRIQNGHIKRIIWIMINARSAPASELDSKINTPGALAMFLGTVDSAIDSRTSAAILQIKEALIAEWAATAQALPPPVGARFTAIAQHTYIVNVDFDSIADENCRARFHSIATSWALPKTQIDALMLAGQGLLFSTPAFLDAAKQIGAAPLPTAPTLQQACAAVRTAVQ